MAGCVLRASGAAFDVDAFLKTSSLRPPVVYRKGQRRKPASRGPHTLSGFNLVVCSGETSADVHGAEVLAFLQANRVELERLRRFSGVESVVLEFAVPQDAIASRGARFPADLLALAGTLGIDIQVTFYLVG